MSTFKKVQIVEVVAEGFKGFKERTVLQLEEGKNTFIGDNGLGKSSIGELIVWVLTGKNIQGKQKDLNIINKDSDVAIGTIVFLDETGEEHAIERKMNTATHLKFDGKKVSQKRLEELVETELFLLIFNPMYFLSLDKEGSRNTVFSLIPGVEKGDVLAELNAKEKAFLEGETFELDTTNEYLKNRRKDQKELEDRKKYAKGYMAKLEEKIEIPTEQSFDDKQIEAVEKELEGVIQKKPVLKNLSDILLKKAELDKSIAYVKEKRFEGEKVKLELLNKKAMFEQQIKSEQEKVYQPLNISKMETDIAILRSNYTGIQSQTKTLSLEAQELDKKQIHFHEGDECPSCKQLITKQAVNTLNGELHKQVSEAKGAIHKKQTNFQSTLAELEKEGKQLLASITKAKEEDALNRSKFEATKKEMVSKLQTELDKVIFQLNNLSKEETKFDIEQHAKVGVLQKQIEALGIDKLEKENTDTQKAFDEQVRKERSTLQQQLQVLRKEKDSVLQSQTKRESLMKQDKKNKEELAKKQSEVEAIEKREALIESQIAHMKIFNAQKSAMMNRFLAKHLNAVSIKLEKTVQSTGEIKDCFEILYDEKELKICSTSETIKAGIELSHMIRELSGLDYPVFVDNGESITSYDISATQTIETLVVKDKKLSVRKGGTEKEIVPTPKEKVTAKCSTVETTEGVKVVGA